jgi:hypothetical protein
MIDPARMNAEQRLNEIADILVGVDNSNIGELTIRAISQSEIARIYALACGRDNGATAAWARIERPEPRQEAFHL